MTIVLIGAGQRGRIYADYAVRAGYAAVSAIVEPDPQRRQEAAQQLGVGAERCFAREEELFALGKIADAAIIASMDRDHYRQALGALALGYDLLLEKPVSPVLAECQEIEKRAKEAGRLVLVCHVLRYTPFFSALKALVQRQALGRIITIRHEENIGNFHMAHSFVRGNWANAEKTSPIILQKSCHDFDILVWLTGSRAQSLSSVGELTYFKEESAPEGGAERCWECKHNAGCRFAAQKCYLPALGQWPATVVASRQTPQALAQALKTGPYGRCVYRCGNDVCDHQTTLITFENGVTASFTMSAFTNRMNRSIRILCEDGEIWGNDEESRIVMTRFASNMVEEYSQEALCVPRPQSGHGGGDTALVDDFFNALHGREAKGVTTIDQSLESHFMAWAAEESRLAGGRQVPLKELRERPQGAEGEDEA